MSKRAAARRESHRPHPAQVNAAKTIADRDAADLERRVRAVPTMLALGRAMHNRLASQGVADRFPGGNR